APTPSTPLGFPSTSAEDAEDEGGGPGGLGEFELFEPDPGAARVVEQPGAVAQQDGHDGHVELVEQPRPEALGGHPGAQDADVAVTRGRLGCGDGTVQVGGEGDAGDRGVGDAVGEDELGSVPAAAVGFALVLGALVGVVAIE